MMGRPDGAVLSSREVAAPKRMPGGPWCKLSPVGRMARSARMPGLGTPCYLALAWPGNDPILPTASLLSSR